jgi:hypothetical protein
LLHFEVINTSFAQSIRNTTQQYAVSVKNKFNLIPNLKKTIKTSFLAHEGGGLANSHPAHLNICAKSAQRAPGQLTLCDASNMPSRIIHCTHSRQSSPPLDDVDGWSAK